jgi:ribosomal protein L37E
MLKKSPKTGTDWQGGPEDDPNVVEALRQGRDANDIMVITCSDCGWVSYYNEGSHCGCRHCGRDLMPKIENDECSSLADYWYYEPYPPDRGTP